MSSKNDWIFTYLGISLQNASLEFGSTWGHNFYMGTQKGSKLDFNFSKLLIDAFELKISIKICCCDDHLPCTHTCCSDNDLAGVPELPGSNLGNFFPHYHYIN